MLIEPATMILILIISSCLRKEKMMEMIRIKMPPTPARALKEEHLNAVMLQIAQVVAEWPQVGLDVTGQRTGEVWGLDVLDYWQAQVVGDEVVVSTNLIIREDVRAAMKLVIYIRTSEELAPR